MELEYKEEQKNKEAFYCSDYGKLNLDLYYGFVGETKTNPVSWNDTLKWGAGKGVEMQMLDILKMNDRVDQDYVQEEHGRVDFEREGVQIHGYIDAMLKDGTPIEIKSVNNKNFYDIKSYEEGYPKEGYVGQLAIYMDCLGVDKGYLFVATVDGMSHFWFECKRLRDRVYQCGETIVYLDEEYKRWNVLYNENVLKKIEPECPIRYKRPIQDIEWKEISKGDISKARNNKKVIGDEGSWRIQYSPWKDKIIEKEGADIGYSEAELKLIAQATKGYTNWK